LGATGHCISICVSVARNAMPRKMPPAVTIDRQKRILRLFILIFKARASGS